MSKYKQEKVFLWQEAKAFCGGSTSFDRHLVYLWKTLGPFLNIISVFWEGYRIYYLFFSCERAVVFPCKSPFLASHLRQFDSRLRFTCEPRLHVSPRLRAEQRPKHGYSSIRTCTSSSHVLIAHLVIFMHSDLEIKKRDAPRLRCKIHSCHCGRRIAIQCHFPPQILVGLICHLP